MLVEGVNMVKKAVKANPGKNVKGGVVEREQPLHISNVAAVCPETNAPSRGGPQDPARRKQGPRGHQIRRGAGQVLVMAARLKELYGTELRGQLQERAGAARTRWRFRAY